jgi:hypothetical protein
VKVLVPVRGSVRGQQQVLPQERAPARVEGQVPLALPQEPELAQVEKQALRRLLRILMRA